MPKKKAAKLTAKEKNEKRFVTFYIEKGCLEIEIPDCERRAHLKAGDGARILKLKAVKEDIHRRMEPVRNEQFRQKVIADAAALAEIKIQDALREKVKGIRKIDPELLESELMSGVMLLDWNRWPKEKLEVIKVAAVWNGTFEAGNTRRLAPPDNSNAELTGGMYTALFHRLGSQPVPDVPPSEIAPKAQDDGVYDLTPPPPPAVVAPAKALDTRPNVITVEVG